MSEPAPHWIVECEGPIPIVTFNRPERRNAFSAEMLARELAIGLPVFATKDAMEGPRAFAEKRKPVLRGE